MYMYMLLTGLTFYVVAFMLSVPSLGPVPAPVVKTVLFVLLHCLLHRVLKSSRR